MSHYRSEREEKLLEDLLVKYQALGIVVWGAVEGAPGTYAKLLVKSDGTVKVEGVTTISGSIDVSDKWTRQLGQVDIQRYLGSAISALNPLHSQIVVSGAVIDPRSIRSLISSDVVTAYGSQTQALLQRATTYDLLVQLRNAGVEIDPRDVTDRAARRLGIVYGSEILGLLQRPGTGELLVQLCNAAAEYDARDVSDRAARLLGIIYGDQGQLAQRATSRDIYVQLRTVGTTEYDARQIRALISSDIITAYGSQTRALLQRATTYDLIVQLRSAGVEIDPRSIRALTSADVVSAVQSSNWDFLYDILMVTNRIDEVDYTWNVDKTCATAVYKKSGGTVCTITYTWNPDKTLNKQVRT